jgi:hypothetical protein
MKLVWLVISLVLIGIIGVQESFADEVRENRTYTLEEALEIQRNRTDSSIMNDSLSVENTYYPRELTAHDVKCMEKMGNAMRAEKIMSPKWQIFCGHLPKNIMCNNDLDLIFKSSDGSPACVKSKTSEKLIQRGWALS